MDKFSDLYEIRLNELIKDRNILHELNDCEDIREIFHEYNKLGFLTYTQQSSKAQPGHINNSVIFKSEYHRSKERTKENILCTGVRKQRAFIRGYMNKDMANYIFNKLENDSYIFVRDANNNRPCPFDIKFGSVNFIDDKPVLIEDLDWHHSEDTKNIPDADWSFNLGLPMRKSFSLLLGREYPNIDSTDIVEFEAVDIRWNENGYMWTKLLQTIKKYKSQL